MTGKGCRANPARQRVQGQRILFTGPDGVGNYRVRQYDFPHHIGIGPLSPETTGDLNYLFRPAPCTPSLLSKNRYVGGVGWGVEHGLQLNARNLLSNNQIKRSEFRSAMEDRIYQILPDPWQDPSASGDQSVLMNHHQDYNHSNPTDQETLSSEENTTD